jgi:membrane protein required for colicin V production
MNWLDIIVIILLIISAIGGLASGLIKSVLSLVGLIVGILVAGHFYATLAGYLTFIPNESGARIFSFILIVLVFILIAALLGVMLTKVVSAISLGWLNRLGGAAFGVILGAIFIAAILSLWIKYTGSSNSIASSLLGPFLVDRLPLVLALLPAEFNSVHQFFQ